MTPDLSRKRSSCFMCPPRPPDPALATFLNLPPTLCLLRNPQMDPGRGRSARGSGGRGSRDTRRGGEVSRAGKEPLEGGRRRGIHWNAGVPSQGPGANAQVCFWGGQGGPQVSGTSGPSRPLGQSDSGPGSRGRACGTQGGRSRRTKRENTAPPRVQLQQGRPILEGLFLSSRSIHQHQAGAGTTDKCRRKGAALHGEDSGEEAKEEAGCWFGSLHQPQQDAPVGAAWPKLGAGDLTIGDWGPRMQPQAPTTPTPCHPRPLRPGLDIGAPL